MQLLVDAPPDRQLKKHQVALTETNKLWVWTTDHTIVSGVVTNTLGITSCHIHASCDRHDNNKCVDDPVYLRQYRCQYQCYCCSYCHSSHRYLQKTRMRKPVSPNHFINLETDTRMNDGHNYQNRNKPDYTRVCWINLVNKIHQTSRHKIVSKYVIRIQIYNDQLIHSTQVQVFVYYRNW